MAPVWYGFFLILTLCWGPVAVDAHSGRSPAIVSPDELQSVTTPPPVAVDVPAPVPPMSAAPDASNAWMSIVLLSLCGLSAVPRRRWSQGLPLGLVLLLGVFACESATHSVHHLRDPRQAERCPLLSASQHLTGLSASPATPDLPRLVPTSDTPVGPTLRVRSAALAGEQSRAPPLQSA
jgi:hypothetical protein